MIIHFEIDLKGYQENISKNYIDFDYTCPKCGAKHAMRRHGFYQRHVLYLEKDSIQEILLSVLRLKCTSCLSTHAILPKEVVPYSIYSLGAFLQITSEVLLNNHPLAQTAEKYEISYQLISFFIKRILLFQDSCRLVLRELYFFDVLDLSAMLQLIITRSTFITEYFMYTRWAFLMKKFHTIFPKPIFIGSSLP